MKTKEKFSGRTYIKLFSLLAILFFLTFTGFGCGKKSEEKKAKSTQSQATQNQKKNTQAPTKITIAQFGHVFVYLPIYVAKEKGFFAEEGLDVKYVSSGGDDKTWAAVTSGSAQFGVADPTFVAIAREKGDNSGKIIASIIDGVPFWGVSKKSVKIKEIQGLNDLRVATYPAPSTNYSLMSRIIKQYHLHTKIVQGAFGTLLALLQNDKADIAMVLEPTVSLSVVKQGYHVVFSYKNFYKNFALTGLSTTTTYINKHPEVCQKVVNALQKAYHYCYSDLDGTIAVAKKEFSDIPEHVLRIAVKRMLDDETIPKSVVLSKKSWEEAISLRKYIGDLKGNAPFLENVDDTFAAKAVKDGNR